MHFKNEDRKNSNLSIRSNIQKDMKEENLSEKPVEKVKKENQRRKSPRMILKLVIENLMR